MTAYVKLKLLNSSITLFSLHIRGEITSYGTITAMIKAAIFDFYGVICADAYTSWQNTMFDSNDPIRVQFIALANENDLGQIPLSEFYRRAALLAGVETDQAITGMGSAMKIDLRVMELIDKLRLNGVKTAILSNSPVSLYDTIANFGIRQKFDAVLCSGEVGFTKPGQAIFDELMKRLKVSPDEAVFIDDRQNNTDAAQQIGINSILFHDSGQLHDSFEKLGLLT